MPRIPTYDGPQVDLQQLPGAGYSSRATPEDYGSAAAGLLAQAGNNLAAHADRIAQVFDAEDERMRAANVRSAINEAYNRLREIDDGTANKPGIYARQGKDSLNIYREAVTGYRKAAQDAQSTLGTQQEVEAYRAHMDAALSRRLDQVARTQIQNRERYRIQSHRTRIAGAIREGIRSPDARTLAEQEAIIREDVAELYSGEDRETIDLELQNQLHAMYAGSLDAIVREDPLAAADFYERYQEKFLPESAEQIRDVVQGSVRLTRIPAQVDEWIGAPGGVTTQAELYSRINETYRDPDDAQVARQHGRIRLAEMRAEAEASQEAQWRDLRNKIIGNQITSIGQLSSKLPMLTDAQFRMAESLIESRVTRKEDDDKALYEWNAMSDRQRAHIPEEKFLGMLKRFTAATQSRIQGDREKAVKNKKQLDYWHGQIEVTLQPELAANSMTRSDPQLKQYVIDLAQKWREMTRTEDMAKVSEHVTTMLANEFVKKGASRIRVEDLHGRGEHGYINVQPMTSLIISAYDTGGNEVQWLPNNLSVRDQIYWNAKTLKVQPTPPPMDERVMAPGSPTVSTPVGVIGAVNAIGNPYNYQPDPRMVTPQQALRASPRYLSKRERSILLDRDAAELDAFHARVGREEEGLLLKRGVVDMARQYGGTDLDTEDAKLTALANFLLGRGTEDQERQIQQIIDDNHSDIGARMKSMRRIEAAMRKQLGNRMEWERRRAGSDNMGLEELEDR